VGGAYGGSEEFPESLICIGKLDTGWRVLSHNKYGCPYLQRQDLARLSIDHDLLLCLIEEHVMASSAELWSKGVRDYIFEIPLKVAQTLVGLKHDESCPHLIGGRFEVMSRIAPKSNPLSRLFGRN
jgi:hypothetical protein